MPDYVDQLILALRLLQFIFHPFEHLSRIGGISYKKPVLVIVCLSVQGDYFYIIEFRKLNTVIAFCFQLVVRFLIQPFSPSVCQTSDQNFFSFAFIVIDVYRPTLMISHRWNYPCVTGLFQPFYNGKSIIQVVILSLLPNVVRGVISCPYYQVEFHLAEIFQKKVKSLKRKIAFSNTSPISCTVICITLV